MLRWYSSMPPPCMACCGYRSCRRRPHVQQASTLAVRSVCDLVHKDLRDADNTALRKEPLQVRSGSYGSCGCILTWHLDLRFGWSVLPVMLTIRAPRAIAFTYLLPLRLPVMMCAGIFDGSTEVLPQQLVLPRERLGKKSDQYHHYILSSILRRYQVGPVRCYTPNCE